MAKKTDLISELRKKLTEKKVVIGRNETKRKLMKKELSFIILAKNISDEIKEEFEKICKLTDTQLEITIHTNEELGILCKKQFPVSVLGVLR